VLVQVDAQMVVVEEDLELQVRMVRKMLVI